MSRPRTTVQQLRRDASRRWSELRADAVMVSFPKCGRTWLRLMLGETIDMHFGLEAPGRDKLELFPLGAARRDVPRVFVSHDGHPDRQRPEELSGSKGRYRRHRVLLLVRDPRDAVVSLYFQAVKRQWWGGSYQGTLHDFLHEDAGSVASILAYYNTWARQRTVPRALHLVRYEDLHADPHTELRSIMSFIGVVDVSDATIDKAVEAARFERMRELEQSDALGSYRLKPVDPDDEESYKTRRGKAGGYVDYFDGDELAWLDARVAELDPWYGYRG